MRKKRKKMLMNIFLINAWMCALVVSYDNLTQPVDCTTDYCDATKVLSELLHGYEKHQRPFLKHTKPDDITVGMWILSIDSINLLHMEYRIDFFLRQEWSDHRLKHTYPDILTLSHSSTDKIWLPDTYFVNAKQSMFHYVSIPNKMVRIYPNGRVMFNCRISLSASCQMDLHNFPVDNQECYLLIGSYGYNKSHIRYNWENHSKRVNIGVKKRSLPQFFIRQLKTHELTEVYSIGNWSNLEFRFSLTRSPGHYFLVLYSPCVMIVVISWIGFFVPKERLVARIGLAIFSMLTCVTILNIQNANMPKVSYVKFSDWYLIICGVFVFAIFVEYTIVLYLYVKEKWFIEKQRRRREKEEKDKEKQKNNKVILEESVKTFLKKNILYELFYESRHDLLFEKLKEQTPATDTGNYLHPNKDGNPSDLPIGGRDSPLYSFNVNIIDERSRILFPLSFAIVNTVYWVMFLIKRASNPEHEHH